MKAAKIRKFILSASFVLGGIAMLMAFQNCSSDATFNTNPSIDGPSGLRGGNGGPGQPRIGGDGEVQIQLNELPTDGLIGDPQQVEFEVTSPVADIVNVECILNGQAIACTPDNPEEGPSGVTTVPIPPEVTNTPGANTLIIRGENANGDIAEEVIEFEIFQSIVQVTKPINVNVTNDKADIIIVVDNSGSMEFEQMSMASRIGNMMDRFKHLDYRISVTTTSPIGLPEYPSSLNYVDGQFLQLSDGSYCVNPNSGGGNLASQQTMLGDVVQRSETGNGWERGIYMTYRAFERSQQNGSNESQCLRVATPKHVILISDEDETLVDNQGNNLPDIAKSDGDNLRNYVQSLFPGQIFKFHTIIVDPFSEEGRLCLEGHGAKFGTNYALLAQATGGVIGSVCAVDYANQLEQIGQSISDSALSYALDCVAVLNPDTGTIGSVTNSSGAVVGAPFNPQFNGDKVEFDQLLPQGNYTATHWCYQ